MTWRTFIINTLKPSNNELRSVMKSTLLKNFKNVHVDLATSPDLTAPPFNMTSNGFGRKLVVAEVGTFTNLYPFPDKGKIYDIKDVCEKCELPKGFIFGACGCPSSEVGKNGELVADANFSENKVASKYTIMVDNHSTPFVTNTTKTTKFVVMGDLAVSEPGPAEVVHIKCSKRTGEKSLPECLREGMANHYGQRCVSLAGIFLLLRGKANVHIAPNFPEKPFKSIEEMEKWFGIFDINAPLVCTSVMNSYDPGFGMRQTHTHCYSSHNDGGHLNNDITPEIVEYEGWFTAAEKIYKID